MGQRSLSGRTRIILAHRARLSLFRALFVRTYTQPACKLRRLVRDVPYICPLAPRHFVQSIRISVFHPLKLAGAATRRPTPPLTGSCAPRTGIGLPGSDAERDRYSSKSGDIAYMRASREAALRARNVHAFTGSARARLPATSFGKCRAKGTARMLNRFSTTGVCTG